METPISTPMQLLKQELLEFIEINEKTYTKGELADYMDGVKKCIARIDEHPPKEQEAIKQAYVQGREDEYHKEDTKNATQYFNQTYKETQNKQQMKDVQN